MSTRAIYIFRGHDEQYTVYKHHDGYLSGAAECLTVARRLSWCAPRFEPDEAAAAFVAAAKLATHLTVADGKLVFDSVGANRYPLSGDVRLLNVSRGKGVFHKAPCDIEFAYLIESKHGDWYVTAYATDFWDAVKAKNATKIWEGGLPAMALGGKKDA